jgi:hypothetical protein
LVSLRKVAKVASLTMLTERVFLNGLIIAPPTVVSVDSDVERVRQRVMKGGHDIPDENIRRRQKGSFANLTAAFKIADEVVLIDNSGLEPHEAFVIGSGDILSFNVDDSKELHKLFSQKVCEAYDLVRVEKVLESKSEERLCWR